MGSVKCRETMLKPYEQHAPRYRGMAPRLSHDRPLRVCVRACVERNLLMSRHAEEQAGRRGRGRGQGTHVARPGWGSPLHSRALSMSQM